MDRGTKAGNADDEKKKSGRPLSAGRKRRGDAAAEDYEAKRGDG